MVATTGVAKVDMTFLSLASYQTILTSICVGTAETDGRGGYNKRTRRGDNDIRSDRKFCCGCAV